MTKHESPTLIWTPDARLVLVGRAEVEEAVRRARAVRIEACIVVDSGVMSK